ncbi:sugar phosphate isomerase/epimerase family protein [Gulosibacter sp. 10]|uniref:sugar phosphate isomerase/epimerase family protein n=1 Tax=Gulosibacter sp. 10 TaxID=1255570 RepID=UPI00097EE8BC|nr:sugar phosphate isomerase/epimerase family protein [Gulosibacter sp. 10]SJM63899.1 4-hydroxyphenylpyruvate dioxygenase [Gulosibacter sp. 10]
MTAAPAPRLLPTSWSTAGDVVPQSADERSPLALADRVRAVAETGWNGFGLVYDDLMEYQREHSLGDLKRLLDDHGLDHVELEFLGDWWTADERRAASDEMRENLFHAAEALGAKTVKIAPETADAPVDRDVFFAEFDALATEAARHGTRVALETLPFAANMRTIEEGIELVTEVANPAGGLCVDIWHVARGGTDYSVIRDSLPAQHLFVVELDDAAAQPIGRLWEDTVHRRLLPGHGAFDVPEFINAVRATGYDGIWGVEIISHEIRATPLPEALAAMRGAALECFAEADARLAAAR